MSASLTLSNKPFWMKLAREFSEYISHEHVRYVRIYEGTVADFGQAAILRVWVGLNDNIKMVTLALTEDTAWCSSTYGCCCIDLADPKSFEKILQWLIRVKVVGEGTVLREPLK
jgi:hypothetical protein